MKSEGKTKLFKFREMSGNFLKSQGKSLMMSKSAKSQRILFSSFLFISFLQDFEMRFLSEKMKSMLQSKQSDQFDILRLRLRANGRHIVVCYMLHPFAHPVACCCVLLRKV